LVREGPSRPDARDDRTVHPVRQGFEPAIPSAEARHGREKREAETMKLHNRNRESTFQPLDNPHARLSAKSNPGGGLGRDRKARIVDMLFHLKQTLLLGTTLSGAFDEIDAIIEEVEK
jgi:hypothetical protein